MTAKSYDQEMSIGDWVGIILMFIGVVLFVYLVLMIGQTIIEERDVRSQCNGMGYPRFVSERYLLEPNRYFCLRLENGSEKMIQVQP